MAMLPLLHLTSNPWGLPPRVQVSADARGGELPKMRVHVERRHDWNPRAPRDSWGCATPYAGQELYSEAVKGPASPPLFAYRDLWEAYVLTVAAALSKCADALEGQKKQATADLRRGDASLLVAHWRLFDGVPEAALLQRSSYTLHWQQKVVLDAGKLVIGIRQFCPDAQLPDPPPASAQSGVIDKVEAATLIAHGSLFVLERAPDGSLTPVQSKVNRALPALWAVGGIAALGLVLLAAR